MEKIVQISIKNHNLELFTDKGFTQLQDDEKYIGYRLDKEKISAVILKIIIFILKL